MGGSWRNLRALHLWIFRQFSCSYENDGNFCCSACVSDEFQYQKSFTGGEETMSVVEMYPDQGFYFPSEDTDPRKRLWNHHDSHLCHELVFQHAKVTPVCKGASRLCIAGQFLLWVWLPTRRKKAVLCPSSGSFLNVGQHSVLLPELGCCIKIQKQKNIPNGRGFLVG